MKLLSLILVVSFFASCAKDKSMERLLKENVYTKEFFSNAENDDYLYVVSVGKTPKDITASRPYWQGQERVVSFSFEDATLNVIEKTLDDRYSENPRNGLPVISFEIEHVDYKCTEDEYGDCTNKEEEDKNKSSHARRFFKIKKLAFENNNTLPINLNNLFTSCFKAIKEEIVDTQIEKGFMNFIVRKTYSAGIECADVKKYEDIKNTTFTIDYHHSIAKMSSIASKDYEKVDYPYKDTNTFGYFTTNRNILDVDNSTTDESEKVYLSRFNPKNKEIVYYLNAPFYEKGMEGILASTIEGVEKVNESFKAAGVDTKIVLKDGSNLPIGDLRYNFIILVKDPQASGVIGYGPSITNPRTGEIVNARTVMYYGTMKKYLKYTYDDIVKEFNASRNLQKVPTETKGIKEFAQEEITAPHNHDEHIKELVKKTTSNQKIYRHKVGSVYNGQSINIEPSYQNLKTQVFDLNRKVDFKTINKEEPLAQIEEMSRMNVYHGSMFNFHAAVKSTLRIDNAKKLLPWDQLTKEEQEALIERLMPASWISTLVHEIGHNLGLRHNFSGSEDKDNFYTDKERSVMGVKKAIKYSSVMDYAYSELNSLPQMGKYDIAAIKFGYAREVETKGGQTIKLSSTYEKMDQDIVRLKSGLVVEKQYLESQVKEIKDKVKNAVDESEKKELELKLKSLNAKLAKIDSKLAEENFEAKDYQFCTDEHVAVNPGCNRFDEGTGMTEIVDHYISDYHERYLRRNFRGNRETFSSFEDGSYLARIYNTFRTMRLVFEVFDRISTTYTLKPEDWENNEFLKDLKIATQKVSEFYLDVIKTPGINCILLNEKMQIETQIAITDPVFKQEGDVANCFESEILSGHAERNKLIIAQYGKNVDNARSKFLKDKYKPDVTAISVRGIWLDKVVAMNFLSARDMGQPSFNTSLNNFFDYAEFAQPAINTLVQMFMDKVEGKVDITVKTPTGMQVIPQQELSYKLSTSSNIKEPYSYLVRSWTGFKEATNDLKKALMRKFKQELQISESSKESVLLSKVFDVTKLSTYRENNDTAYDLIAQVEGRRFGLFKYNSVANMLIGIQNVNDQLSKLEREKLIEIYQARAKEETMPEDTAEDYKAVWKMDLNILFRYLTNDLPNNMFVKDGLEALSV